MCSRLRSKVWGRCWRDRAFAICSPFSLFQTEPCLRGEVERQNLWHMFSLLLGHVQNNMFSLFVCSRLSHVCGEVERQNLCHDMFSLYFCSRLSHVWGKGAERERTFDIICSPFFSVLGWAMSEGGGGETEPLAETRRFSPGFFPYGFKHEAKELFRLAWPLVSFKSFFAFFLYVLHVYLHFTTPLWNQLGHERITSVVVR